MSPRGTRFAETMLGTARLDDGADRRARLDLRAGADTVLRPLGTTRASLAGRIRIAGWADDAHAAGTLEISPLARRRIRYRLTFTAQGRRFTLDGWKSITPLHPIRSMTVLPFTLYETYEHEERPVGSGTLRFPLAGGLAPFLLSFRFPRREDGAELMRPRWKGEAGRTEVWYTTATDPATGSGLWLHHELVAPADGTPPFAHGWAAVFPAEGPVTHARFGPEPWRGAGGDGFTAHGISARPGRLMGSAGDMRWDLAERPAGSPLFTFPRWSWRRPLLPAAQLLPAARASYDGSVTYGDRELILHDAPGASARIYGHGNARRWAWLHADLGGGDVLEIVAAVSMRPGLRRLPPLVFLRLRRRGRTWPRRAERTAVGWAGPGRFTADLGLPRWTVSGRSGLRRIRVEVTQAEERTLHLDYADPDGTPATCHNSERADAAIRLERWWGRWRPEAQWTLDGTAHAEVGTR
ncbi:hypothetical protein ABZ916_15720 [Streptomyces sp. NPDC046853]|uniref:hypothetical protein n=1 Tax=Streptomyces sp. NPDC046853 TaxID=3154920 RepID=UPI0033E0A2D9